MDLTGGELMQFLGDYIEAYEGADMEDPVSVLKGFRDAAKQYADDRAIPLPSPTTKAPSLASL